MKKIMRNYIKSSIDIDSLHKKYKKLMPSSWAMGLAVGRPTGFKIEPRPNPYYLGLRLGPSRLWVGPKPIGSGHGPRTF